MKLFDRIQIRAPRKNKFDLSHERKFSFNMGDLIPIMALEALPGDSFRLKTEIMMRLAPMLAPIMHRVNVKVEYFEVPIRLLWDESEDFFTGGRLGTASPVMPQFNIGAFPGIGGDLLRTGTLWDYLGLPSLTDTQITAQTGAGVPFPKVTALYHRAYHLVWDSYYRDQNVEASIEVPKTSGVVTDTEANMLNRLRKRAWEKDYFTSALPFAQRGPAVSMPIDGVAQVEYKELSDYMDAAGNPVGGAASFAATADPDTQSVLQDGASTPTRVENIEQILLDTSGVTINDLRRSIKLQEWLEKAARVGGRYVEMLKGFFDEQPGDYRLQRPQYLGGSVNAVQISEVLSTVQQVDDVGDPVGNPQGDMTGHGMARGRKNGFVHKSREHAIILGVVSVLPRTAYQQGIPRQFTRETKFDYYWEQFAHLGEQAVLNQELYYQAGAFPGPTPLPSETFGYQSRYAEYKQMQSSVHGDFRSSLAYWHMGRIFSQAPELNLNFIESDPTHRIFAVDDPQVHKLWCHLYHDMSALRPMPYFGTPTL